MKERFNMAKLPALDTDLSKCRKDRNPELLNKIEFEALLSIMTKANFRLTQTYLNG